MASDTEKLTATEVEQRICDAFATIYDVFGELNSMLVAIASRIGDAHPNTIVRVPKAFVMPRSKLKKSASDRYISSDVGLLAQIGGAQVGPEDDEIDDEADDAEDEKKSPLRPVAITDRFLGVRAVLREKGTPPGEHFRPMILASAFGSVTRSTKRDKDRKSESPVIDAPCMVRRKWLKWLVQEVKHTTRPGDGLNVTVTRGQLHASVLSVVTRPLGDIESDGDVATLSEEIVEMLRAI